MLIKLIQKIKYIMNWFYACCIVLVLIVVGFMMFIFMPKPIVFYEPYTDCINIFTDNHELLKKEILENDTTTPVVPIYGFDAIQTHKYPETYKLLRCMPYVRFAGILNLRTKFSQLATYSYAPVANNTIRFFYTIDGTGTNKAGVWIDGEKRFFEEKTWICGDMSREHSLFNNDKYKSITVLFIDIDRHENIHKGTSKNDDLDTDEILSQFAANVEQTEEHGGQGELTEQTE